MISNGRYWPFFYYLGPYRAILKWPVCEERREKYYVVYF